MQLSRTLIRSYFPDFFDCGWGNQSSKMNAITVTKTLRRITYAAVMETLEGYSFNPPRVLVCTASFKASLSLKSNFPCWLKECTPLVNYTERTLILSSFTMFTFIRLEYVVVMCWSFLLRYSWSFLPLLFIKLCSSQVGGEGELPVD